MAKRKYRMTNLELRHHEQAVKIRKMTDRQISEYIHDLQTEAYEKGFKERVNEKPDDVKKFLETLNIPGVGATTVDKLIKYAEDGGYIGMDGK